MFDLFRPRPIRRGLNSQEADLVIKLARIVSEYKSLQEENEELKKELTDYKERYYKLVDKLVIKEENKDD